MVDAWSIARNGRVAMTAPRCRGLLRPLPPERRSPGFPSRPLARARRAGSWTVGRLPLGAAATLLAASLALAQVADEKEPPPAEARPTGPVQGTVYIWEDGDRTLKAWLQEDLTVRRDGAEAPAGTFVVRTGNGAIVRVEGGRRSVDPPVFRSRSGALMTLPGGVLLLLSPEWSRKQVDVFFAGNGIAPDRVSGLGWIDNGFSVRTAPGFPSLELANALAAQAGVELSSPNWWREHTTR